MSTKWSKTIALDRPLHGVSVLASAPSEDWGKLLQEREQVAYQKGRRDGENGLSQQLVQQRTEVSELQRGILDSLSKALPQIIKDSETTLIELAIEAARRVVAGLPIDANMVEAVVCEALRQAEDSADITIQLHAEDLALLRKYDSKLLQGVPDKGPLRFTSSPEITRGGCTVQTRFGLIDARREVKLEQLTQSVSA